MALGAFISGFRIENGEIASGSLDWLTPFNLAVGVCLIGGYALLGACWLIMKTDGSLQERSYAQALTLSILVGIGIALVSASTPLIHPEVAARWFVMPNLLMLLPIPILTTWVWISMIRSIGNRENEARPFICSEALFALCYLGLAISVFPYLVPRALTICDAAAARPLRPFCWSTSWCCCRSSCCTRHTPIGSSAGRSRRRVAIIEPCLMDSWPATPTSRCLLGGLDSG